MARRESAEPVFIDGSADWRDPPPGFLEIEMVEHCGGPRSNGDFVPGCTSAREFRVILLCPTVLFGAQMAATPSRPADP